MKLNVKKFFLYFALFQCVFFLAGCTAAWLSAVSALLPALQAAVSAALSFVMALEGKTVPASVTAAIQKIFSDVAAQITNAQQLITAYQGAASAGTLAQIQAVFQAIVADLGNILSAFNVTDSATVSKFTALVGLAVAAAQSIIALIPLVSSAMSSGASKEVLAAQDQEAAVHIKSVHDGLKTAYKTIRDTSTENADVNTALSTLPTSLP